VDSETATHAGNPGERCDSGEMGSIWDGQDECWGLGGGGGGKGKSGTEHPETDHECHFSEASSVVARMIHQELISLCSPIRVNKFIRFSGFEIRRHLLEVLGRPFLGVHVDAESHVADQVEASESLQVCKVGGRVGSDGEGVAGVEKGEGFGADKLRDERDAEERVDAAVVGV
jgi:hypothetical protein